MWPWEHLAVGYLVYSLSVHVTRRRKPSALAALAVGFGSLFPDLVDKPLGWTFAILSSGTSLAHSVLVAVPLVVIVWAIAAARGRGDVGAGFGVGYLLHLPADAFYPLVFGRPPKFSSFFWPLIQVDSPARGGLLETVVYFLNQYVGLLGTPEATAYLAFEFALLLAAFGLWVYDGYPGAPFRGRKRVNRSAPRD
ncbi:MULTISPECIES: metal-dependent hydrolase [unclassified Haladaptatus]|uniref:metal-dependent hydrolase n=1 Tax=unclassified Haladaptatus TaxID=2622732 RepID=UPI0023E7D104|nr:MULTISPECIES: metal-dependent hydrolase [unclassified Haladaptatus]